MASLYIDTTLLNTDYTNVYQILLHQLLKRMNAKLEFTANVDVTVRVTFANEFQSSFLRVTALILSQLGFLCTLNSWGGVKLPQLNNF